MDSISTYSPVLLQTSWCSQHTVQQGGQNEPTQKTRYDRVKINRIPNMRPEKYLLFFTAYNREGRMNLRRKTGYNLDNINRTISVRPAKHMLLFTVYIQQGGQNEPSQKNKVGQG